MPPRLSLSLRSRLGVIESGLISSLAGVETGLSAQLRV
jgi:hypothetical protein